MGLGEDFFTSKPVFGMLHLSGTDTNERLERAFAELELFKLHGVHAAISEDYHGTAGEALIVAKAALEQNSSIPVGINLLRLSQERALELATEQNFPFVQLDWVAGRYVRTSQLNEEAYLAQRSSNLTVLGGVWPKYYRPVSGSDLKHDIEDAKTRCDVVVVTGAATGSAVPLEKVIDFHDLLRGFPQIIGAGVTSSNIAQYWPYSNGFIVGSAFKKDGNTNEACSSELVERFMDTHRELSK